MLDNDQTQQGGDQSINIQAKGSVSFHGVSYSEARQIAVDVYRANALTLQGVAQRVATERAEHLIEQFLQTMQAKGHDRVDEAASPDFQHTLFEAQKTFARSGNVDTEAILINLLVQRAEEPARNLRQIVLTESVTAISKLNQNQIDLVTVMFLIRDCIRSNVKNQTQLREHFALPVTLTHAVPETNSVFSYLVYTGVVSDSMVMHDKLEDIIKNQYAGVLSYGFERAKIANLLQLESRLEEMLIPAENDPNRVRLIGQNDTDVKEKCKRLGIPDGIALALNNLQTASLFTDPDVIKVFESLGENGRSLFTRWNSTEIGLHTLTTVGRTIGYLNATARRLLKAELSVWID